MIRNTQPDVSVIIASYNTREMLLECLRVIERATTRLVVEVLVIDNASSDGSVEAIRREFPAVSVVANSENRGFGAANNQGMALATADYFLLLNSDAFLDAGALEAMMECLRRNSDAGIVGPRLRYRDGTLQISCFRLPSPSRAWIENLGLASAFSMGPLSDYRRWRHDDEREVEFVIGACLLLRRTIFETVGGFDEGFFMYAEEADWQKRIRDAGWRVLFTPSATAIHLGGASGATEKARINQYFFSSLDRYQRKHHGKLGLLSLRCAMIVGCALRLFFWALIALLPARTELARSKARLHSWLFLRQLTHWHLPEEKSVA